MIPTFTVLKNLLLIPGLGPKTSLRLLASLGISPSSILKNLQPFKQDLLWKSLAALRKSSQLIALNSSTCSFPIYKTVLKDKHDNINRYISNLSYRGGRLRLGYPVNGGRTRCNASTAKKLKINSDSK
jgi:ribosomal protein S13